MQLNNWLKWQLEIEIQFSSHQPTRVVCIRNRIHI